MYDYTIRVRKFQSALDGRDLLEFQLETQEGLAPKRPFISSYADDLGDDDRYADDVYQDRLYVDGMVAALEILLVLTGVPREHVDIESWEGGFAVEPQHADPTFHNGGVFHVGKPELVAKTERTEGIPLACEAW